MTYDLADPGNQQANVLDRAHDLLVDQAPADPDRGCQLVVEPDLGLPALHRLQVRVDERIAEKLPGLRIGGVRPPVERLDEGPGRARWPVKDRVVSDGAACDVVETRISGVEGEEIIDPLAFTERRGHLVLGHVVVLAPASVEFPPGVAGEIPGEAETRGDLVTPAEADGGVGAGGAVIRDLLFLGTNADIEGQVGQNRPGILDEDGLVLGRGVAKAGDIEQPEVAVLAVDGFTVGAGVAAVPVVEDPVGVVTLADVVVDLLVLVSELEGVVAGGREEPGGIDPPGRPLVDVELVNVLPAGR